MIMMALGVLLVLLVAAAIFVFLGVIFVITGEHGKEKRRSEKCDEDSFYD